MPGELAYGLALDIYSTCDLMTAGLAENLQQLEIGEVLKAQRIRRVKAPLQASVLVTKHLFNLALVAQLLA